MSCWQRIRIRLFTKHDHFNIHKTLGIISLSSYLYRFVRFCIYGKSGFIVDDYTNTHFVFNLLTLLCHILLPLSSLIFNVLRERKVEHVFMIWNEMRLHTITFTFRVWLIMFILFVFNFFDDGKIINNYQYTFTFAKFVYILCCHLIADYITKVYGNKDMSTIRVNKVSETKMYQSFTLLVHRFYSYAQFTITTVLIYPTYCINITNYFDLLYFQLSPIHVASFLMTLAKSGFIDKIGYTFWYSSAIFMEWYIIISFVPKVLIISFIIFLFRVWLKINKYLLWMSCFLYFVYTSSKHD